MNLKRAISGVRALLDQARIEVDKGNMDNARWFLKDAGEMLGNIQEILDDEKKKEEKIEKEICQENAAD